MNNNNNFINFIKGIKNPKQAVLDMVKSNNNPMVKNLVEMAQNGNNEGIENFARNLFKEQGKNFDDEFNNFLNQFGIKK